MRMMYSPGTIAALVVLISANTPQPCMLKNSGENPYLIRISWKARPHLEKTVGHGSLIKTDKVLSTCIPVERGDVLGQLVHLTGINSVDDCLQVRTASQVEYHPDCDPDESLIQNDFSLWTPSEAFAVEGTPFLWGSTVSQTGSRIADAIHRLKHGVGNLRVTVLASDSGSMSETSLKLPWSTQEAMTFVPWVECLNISRSTGNSSSAQQANPAYFCGRCEAIAAGDNEKAWSRDWHSGAPIFAHFNDLSVPVGLLSRRVESDLFLVVTFTWDSIGFFMLASGNRASGFEPLERDWCKITDKDQYPFLMRIIWFNHGIPLTTGHGSLVREDKILTTCTRYKDLPLLMKNNHDWQIRGYNNRIGCSTSRQPSKIIKHPDCSNLPADDVYIHDFAVWSPTADFSVEGAPYLFDPVELPEIVMNDVKSLLRTLNETNQGVLGVFDSYATRKDGSLHQEKTIAYISRRDCDSLLNMSHVDDSGFIGQVERDGYFLMCGWNLIYTGHFNTSPVEALPIKTDWYSGAPVLFKNAAAKRIPLGINSGTVHSESVEEPIHIFSTFDEEFFLFLLKNFVGRARNEGFDVPYSTRWPNSVQQRFVIGGYPKITVVCIAWFLR